MQCSDCIGLSCMPTLQLGVDLSLNLQDWRWVALIVGVDTGRAEIRDINYRQWIGNLSLKHSP